MIDYKLWQQRLDAELGNDVKVGYAVDMQTVLKNAIKVKTSVFVLPGSDRVQSRQDDTNYLRDRLSSSVQIVVIAKDYSDAKGDAATDTIKSITDQIYAALTGWQPADCIDTARYVSGKRLGLVKGGLLVWVETYETTEMRTAA